MLFGLLNKIKNKRKSFLVQITIIILVFTSLLAIYRPKITDRAKAINQGYSSSLRNLNLQGMGFVTGMLTHPTDTSILYARTDVGGIYKQNFVTNSWIPLTDAFKPEEEVSLNVEAIAIDPSNPNLLYATVGSKVKSYLIKSSNRGDTWQKSQMLLNGQNIFVDGNDAIYRGGGERLIVDPLNSNTLYYGSRKNGFLKSADGGQVWSEISLPNSYTSGAGVAWVLAKENALYLAVPDKGIYIYKNNVMSKIFDIPIGSFPFRSQITNNNLYGSFTSSSGGGGFFKYNLTTQVWKEIGPEVNKAVQSFIVMPDEQNIQLTYLKENNQTDNIIYLTSDGGLSWRQIVSNYTVPNWYTTQVPMGDIYDKTWYVSQEYFFNSSMVINPTNPNSVIYSNGWGVFQTNNIYDSTVSWASNMKGFEELVVNTVTKVRSGPLISAVWDVGAIISLTPEVTKPFRLGNYNYLNQFTNFDYSFNHPEVIVGTGSSQTFGTDDLRGQLLKSVDSGDTWTNLTLPDPYMHSGNVAVSSGDKNNYVLAGRLVYPMDSWNGATWYTKDGGLSWNKSRGLPEGNMLQLLSPASITMISDKVNQNIFYQFQCSPSTNGWQSHLYRSDDKGETFALVNTDKDILPCVGIVNLKVNPYKEGDLWFTPINQETGIKQLWHSPDGGVTWSSINGLTDVDLVAMGAKNPNLVNTKGTMYVTAKVNQNWGIYMSTDILDNVNNPNWVKVSTPEYGANLIDAIDADVDTFGKVYLGTGGRGVFDLTIISDQSSTSSSVTNTSLNTNTSSQSNSLDDCII